LATATTTDPSSATPSPSPAPVPAPAPEVEHPLRNRNFRLLWIGGSISFLGDQFYMVALPWLILEKTGSAVAMGGVMMAGAIPRALLMLMGGVVSDHFSPRKIMMSTATSRTICVAVIGLLLWFDMLKVWELYALAVAFGIADAFAAPAQSAYTPFLIKPEQMVKASSIGQSTAQLTTIVGPVPAGFVIKQLGIAWAFFLDAISFLFIIGALWKLPDPPKSQSTRKPPLAAIAEGFTYVVKDVPLSSLMLLAMVMNFSVSGPVSLGITYLIKTRFNSPTILGALTSAVAAGTLLGALLAGVWKIRRRGVMILLVAAALSPCLAGIGLVSTAFALGGIMFTIGVLAGFMNVHIGAWIMQRIDAAVRGRVASVLMLASVGITPISFAVAGLLVAWSLKYMFLLSALAMLLAAAGASVPKSVREIE